MMNLGEHLVLSSPAEIEAGMARLSRGGYFREASLEMTLSILTESAAATAGVERVGIWALNDDRSELRCLEMYARSTGCHSSGDSLSERQYPSFFLALDGEGAVVADSPYLHPATCEFAEDYLPLHKISAILATPIHIRGELQGVICLEQVGVRQPWSTMHRLFAQGVANLVTLALVEYEAGEARRQLLTASERLRAVFDASNEAMLLGDWDSGIVLDANRQAELLFGQPRAKLIGRHQRSLQRVGEAVSSARASILRGDGQQQQVEVLAQVADLGDGRRLILGTFRSA